LLIQHQARKRKDHIKPKDGPDNSDCTLDKFLARMIRPVRLLRRAFLFERIGFYKGVVRIAKRYDPIDCRNTAHRKPEDPHYRRDTR
jgi:hypothetical protein